VRSVGELIENQYRIGLVRMERAIKEKMSLQDIETMMPHDLINAKPVFRPWLMNSLIRASSPSLWIRPIRFLKLHIKDVCRHWAPAVLTRERAGFEVRECSSHSLRTHLSDRNTEGPNIGLIVFFEHLRQS